MRPFSCVIIFTCFAISFLFFSNYAFGQSFVGFSPNDNFITEVYTNPGYATNDDALQINVGGYSFLAGNNAYLIDKSSVLAKGELLTGNSTYKMDGTMPRAFWMNEDILGPGVAFKIKKRFSFAVTTRARYLYNADNLDNNVFKLIDGKIKDTSYQYAIHNFSFTAQLFSEINFTYSGYIYQSDDYNLEGGATLKILTGIEAAGVGILQAQFKAYQNDMLNHLSGTANVAFTPYTNQWLSVGQPYGAFDNRTNNMSVGADFGLAYEYTPISDITGTRDGYVFRMGVSITDIGSINYTGSSTTGSYTAHVDTFLVNQLNKSSGRTYGQSIEQYLTDSTVKQTGAKSKFKVGLPTAMHINADLKVAYGRNLNVYVSGSALLNLRAPSADKYVSHYISTFNVSPRVLWKQFGVGIPFTFNTYKQGAIGLVCYIGPFYIGSGSLVNLGVLNNISTIDGFAGFTLRIKGRQQQY